MLKSPANILFFKHFSQDIFFFFAFNLHAVHNKDEAFNDYDSWWKSKLNGTHAI